MKRRLPRILEILIALVFLYAGTLKALDPAALARDIENYRLLPAWPSALWALYLPWLEITAAGALLLGLVRQGALWLLFTLSLLFVCALGSAWLRGLDISCGCFGENSSSVVTALIRAAVLAGTLAWLLISDRRSDKTACPQADRSPASR